MLQLEIIRDLPRLLEFRPDWSFFADRVPGVTPFQTPEWLLTWWKHFGSGDLRVFVFRQGEQVLGVVPCFILCWNGLRQLTLIGAGISDYLDPLVLPEARGEVRKCFREYLEQDGEWEICDFQDLTSDSFLFELTSGSRVRLEVKPDLPCTEVRIAGNFETYWGERPSGLRRNIRRYGEKARIAGELKLKIDQSANEETLGALIRLHTARWQEQGEPGMIRANRSGLFLREVSAQLASRGAVVLFSLSLGTELAAVILSFPFRNVLFSYLSAFDPEHRALGVGKLLLYEAMAHSFQHGYEAWNFLRGEEEYKRDWGVREIPKARAIIRRG